MTELVDVRPDSDRYVVKLRDAGKAFEISLTAQSASLLIAALAQAVVDGAEPNRPNTAWLSWPTLARSAEVSFDVEAIDSGLVGMAVKLPGLMPIRIEIPSESARQLAFALTDAADKSQIPKIEES
jgi:hypothetical protein